MSEDRSTAEWASRVMIGLAGVMLGLYVAGIGWGDQVFESPGWMLVLGGVAFAVGCAVWALLSRADSA